MSGNSINSSIVILAKYVDFARHKKAQLTQSARDAQKRASGLWKQSTL
jgi:hypothetical protein